MHTAADLDGRFIANSYKSVPNLYYGSAYIAFGNFCLDNFTNDVAERMANFAQDISARFVNMNVHVSLQPVAAYAKLSQSPYMKYFGKHIETDQSHEKFGYTVQEWYQTYYLCGVEWCNILSPLASGHLTNITQSTHSIEINFLKTSWGSIVVKSPKSITEYDIPDAMHLKNALRPALYPGWSNSTLRGMFPWKNERRIYDWCPRSDWAIVPIEKREIDIVGSDLVFDAS